MKRVSWWGLIALVLLVFSTNLVSARVLEEVTVKADVGAWQGSGILTTKGEQLDIKALGSWSFNCRRNTINRNIHVHSNPDGVCVKCKGGKVGWSGDTEMPLPMAPAGALIGKINNKIFLVGKHLHLEINSELVGELMFMMNDSNFSDNQCFYQDSLDIPQEVSHLDLTIIRTEK